MAKRCATLHAVLASCRSAVRSCLQRLHSLTRSRRSDDVWYVAPLPPPPPPLPPSQVVRLSHTPRRPKLPAVQVVQVEAPVLAAAP